MTSAYFNRTGLLRFYGTPLMTPVMSGLFGAYAPERGSEGLDTIELKVTIEGTEPTWAEIGNRVALALDMEVGLGPAEALMELAMLSGGAAMSIVAGIVETFDSSRPDMATLFRLALACDDGHALRSVEVEGGWATPKAAHGSCGGDGLFVSACVQVAVRTGLARELGDRLEQAIDAGSETALEDAFWLVEALILGGVMDTASKQDVRAKLAAFLVRDQVGAA